MPFDMSAGATAPPPYPPVTPIQFVNIEITPLLGGHFLVVMQATLLDEVELEFVSQDLANARVETLDEALAIIKANVAALHHAPACAAT